jgi:predicted alpha/beta-fold hydrolase
MANRIGGFFLFQNRHLPQLEAAHPAAVAACRASTGCHDTVAALAPFAGYATFEDYLVGSNPMVPITPRPQPTAVPTLILNAMDDPISVAANVHEHGTMAAVSPSPIILATTTHGSHVCWHGPLGGRSWLNRVVFEYVEAAVAEQANDGVRP